MFTQTSQSTNDFESVFLDSYQMLNDAQKEAVDSIEGPVLVSAGPGTGKTQVLTLRIVNILRQTDTAPENILALTFTEAGAHAMRDRLRRYLGASAYRVPIHTFHSFAGLCIQTYPEAYEKVAGARVADDIDRIDMIRTILSEGKTPLLRPLGNVDHHLKNIRSAIDTLKQEYVTPDTFRLRIEEQRKQLGQIEQYHQKGAHKGKIRGEYLKAEKQLKKNEQLLYIYTRYEALLREKQLYDFADMLLETVVALEQNEDMLRDLQETYQYVLADEHQDVNGTQNNLLNLLVSYHETQPNIFAVGDEKQAIYRFQGASLENFLQFTTQFPQTKLITLDKNYRSGQPILDAAHTLVETTDPDLKKFRSPLTAVAEAKGVVEKRSFSHQAVEDDWLTQAIQEAIDSGLPPEEIAVIVRTNKEVEHIASRLRKAGIAVAPSADSDILEHPITQNIVTLLETVVKPSEEKALVECLHMPYWNIPIDDVVRILAARSYGEPLTSLLFDKKRLQSLKIKNITAIENFTQSLHDARTYAHTHGALRGIEYVLEVSGFLDYLYAENTLEGIRVIRRLYDEVEVHMLRDGATTLSSIASTLRMRQAYNLPLIAPYITSNQQSVAVLTAHKAKGLEYSSVFVPHVIDSSWGGRKRTEFFSLPILTSEVKNQDESDELRLLYVAMTRAKTALRISYSLQNTEGKDLQPSRLLETCSEVVCPQVSSQKAEEKFAPGKALTTIKTTSPFSPSLIQDLVRKQGFSATSINNYCKNPWHYIYRNLLRVPEIKTNALMYGTLMHAVIQKMTSEWRNSHALPEINIVRKFLTSELNKLPITDTEYTQMHEKAVTALLVYREHLLNTLPVTTKDEYKVSAILQTGNKIIPEIPLTGSLDRIDFSETGQALRVVDYKTGQPKSRNQIEGKTKNGDASYKRQLVFYALLLEESGDERYQTRDGVLSFVEPTPRGVIKEELFTITDAEIAELKELLQTAVNDLVTGEFVDREPQEENEYASWIEAVQGRVL